MAALFPQKPPRVNPFWAYRDPLSGKWLTLMTAAQCEQLAQQTFSPKLRQATDAASTAPESEQPHP